MFRAESSTPKQIIFVKSSHNFWEKDAKKPAKKKKKKPSPKVLKGKENIDGSCSPFCVIQGNMGAFLRMPDP